MEILNVCNTGTNEAQVVISFDVDPKYFDEPFVSLVINKRWQIVAEKLLGECELSHTYKLVDVVPGVPSCETSVWSGRQRARQEYQLSFKG